MFKTSQFFEIFHYFFTFLYTIITDILIIENVKQNAEGCQNSIKNVLGQNTHKALKKLNTEFFSGQ